MKLSFKKGEKGFTLVELMVVMAIMAVLSAIVVPAVTGTKQISLDTQVSQDAAVVESAVNKYNANANLAEQLTTDNTTDVLGETDATQIISNKWPEQAITTYYDDEFPATTGNSTDTVAAVYIVNNDGLTTLYSTAAGDLSDFVADYTALNITTLLNEGYLPEEPDGLDLEFSTSKPYNNYLWLLKKGYVEGEAAGSTGGRAVEVFSLTTINTATADTLVYVQVY